jgi:DNA polymerase-3 subunit beta
VTTDGKKLGLSRCDLPEVEGVQPTSAIIPHKILTEVHHNLKDEGMVRLLIGERQVAFDLGNLLYLSNRIDGIFPNYEMVIPKEFSKLIPLNRNRFMEVVSRAALLSEERNNSVIMRFENGRIRISSRTYEMGSYQGVLEVEYDGDPFDIAFNHVYLNDTLRVIGTDTIVMKIMQNTAPVVFVEANDDKSLFLVMPIKLTDIADFNE